MPFFLQTDFATFTRNGHVGRALTPIASICSNTPLASRAPAPVPRKADGTLDAFNDLPAPYRANLNMDPPFGGKVGDKPALN